jgi:hypothetical protein
VVGAAKFVPYGLFVARSLDLSGEGGMNESGAQLIGAVVVPREYAPQKWGAAKLSEVEDARGNNLLPGDSVEDRMNAMRSRHFYGGMSGDDAENAPEGKAPEPRRVVTFAFHPPDWKVNEIARIKGTVSLQYFGSPQVVKLTNAIPASWITDPSKDLVTSSSEKQVSSPKLAELGLSLSLQTGMVQSGMTMLMLQTEGERAALSDAQVFDAEGKPWPTFLQPQMGGSDSCHIIVPGMPKPPLSLALAVSGGGLEVEVPVLLEHVAVITK